MKFPLLFLILAFAAQLGAAEETPILAQGSKLVLRDGRTFENWTIKRETAADVFVLTKTSVTAVPKSLLPEPLNEKFPVNPDAIAAERAALERADAANKIRIAQQEAKEKKEFERRVADAKRQDAANQIYRDQANKALEKELMLAQAAKDREAARQKKQVEDLAVSRDGIILSAIAVTSSGLTLVVRNVADNPRTLDWISLRVSTSNGDVRQPGDCRPLDGKPTLLINGRSERRFLLTFTAREQWVAAAWADRTDLASVFVKSAR